MTDIVVSSFAEAREVYRQRDLRQGLYDAGAVVMDGVLVNLHGEEHKRRRRIENRTFRRDTFDHYENEMFPGIVEQTLAPHVAAGHADLVHFGHALMLNLAAVTAGVDRRRGDAEETERLHEYVSYFIEGATLVHSMLDRDERSAVIAEQLRRWRIDFLQPSIDRREGLLRQLDAGEIDESELPRDILTALLRHRDVLELDDATLAREVAFFLLAGAHTSATAFVRTIDHLLSWLDRHPEDTERARDDRLFVQRCVHETIRLNPSSPTGMRRALADITLPSGREIPEGSIVVIDLVQVNRDQGVFGPDAADFDPTRSTPDGVAPFGLSFAAGMHVCIGQDLAGGVVAPRGAPEAPDNHLFGLVATAVQRMFQAGVRRDPAHPPKIDETTKRPYWSAYPVLFGESASESPDL
jgi:cytochrome P450